LVISEVQKENTMPLQIRMFAMALVFLVIASGHLSGTPAVLQAEEPVLSSAQQQKLNEYAAATARYFTSTEANNILTGLPHAYYGTGKFQVKDGDTWREEYWNLTRGYGSHVNINEVTLRFLSLAVAYKMGWLTYLPVDARYSRSWGQILIGLQTLKAMQTSAKPEQFANGHFYRAYLTCIHRAELYDQDRVVEEIVRSEDIQSSDDNALPFMNLCILEGLAGDQTMVIPDRSVIIELCRQIRAAIDLKGFVVNNSMIFNFTSGIPSLEIWDRLSAEGPVILSAILLSGQISNRRFYEISDSLQNYPVNWAALAGDIIPVGKPSFHAAIFAHGLRHLHGMPTTQTEFSGLNYLETSLKPVLMAHLDFASHYNYQALGTQVMSQDLYGVPILEMNGKQVQFPGNESGLSPLYGQSLSRATSPHAWFIPLARWRYLSQTIIDQLFVMMDAYEPEFFHDSGDDIQHELGWEATIPWTPADKTYAWKASDGGWKYTDAGRPYEALNAAYTLLSTFDALNPDRPLASYHVNADRVKHMAAYFDNGTRLPLSIAHILPLLLEPKKATVPISGIRNTGFEP
jgi:hypothetical protein